MPAGQRPARPIVEIDGKPITIEMIRASLASSEPGQGCMNMHIEDIYAYPFYCEWLLDRLAKAQKPRRRKKST